MIVQPLLFGNIKGSIRINKNIIIICLKIMKPTLFLLVLGSLSILMAAQGESCPNLDLDICLLTLECQVFMKPNESPKCFVRCAYCTDESTANDCWKDGELAKCPRSSATELTLKPTEDGPENTTKESDPDPANIPNLSWFIVSICFAILSFLI